METIRLDTVFCTPLSGTPFKTPRKVKRVVCCDFDDTYLPFDDAEKERSGIIGLEDFIDQYNESLCMVLGWISGSSISALMRKSHKYIRRLPNFIASSLGTEFYWVSDEAIFPSWEWSERIASSGFHLEELRKAVREIKAGGISLEPQHHDYQGQMMECYFYVPASAAAMAGERAFMDEVCARHNIKAVVSGCNPAAGDPDGWYDIQFMPIPCGKAEAAEFAARVYGVDRSDVWAFGDSLNDIGMLSMAENSYLVGNADPKAVERFGKVVPGRYCHGIREKLAELL